MFHVLCLGISWNHDNLNIWKFKSWLSQEQKELSKWNKKHFAFFYKSSLSDIQNKLYSKNVADTTFKTYTNKIVKYNNYIDTTKTIGTIRTKDEDLPTDQTYVTAVHKNDLVITI